MIKCTLADWLIWIEKQHPLTMDLGLHRIRQVGHKLRVISPEVPVITVAGTNGKGSTVAALESIYQAAGYRTGVLTSPHLFHYRERIRVNKRSFDDNTLMQALNVVDEQCTDTLTLTYFEYTTLAALWLFQQHQCDVLILEVGLGGRLDAVNIVDPTVSVITSIGIDHAQYLGDTREKIATEKAGIFRENNVAICGDVDPPETLLSVAKSKQAPLYCINSAYYYEEHQSNWTWCAADQRITDLPIPTILLQNAATSLMAIQQLQLQLPVEKSALITGLSQIQITARCQVISGEIEHIIDVAHNPDAIKPLANLLLQRPCQGRTIAIVAMLQDKDIEGTLSNIKGHIDEWYLGGLVDVKRGASHERLCQAANTLMIESIKTYPNIITAYQAAYDKAGRGDRLVIFGSFHTVAILWDKLPQAVVV